MEDKKEDTELVQHSIALNKKLICTIYKYANLSGYYTDDEANDQYKKDIIELHTSLYKFNSENKIHPIDTGFFECRTENLKLLEYQNEKVNALYKKFEYEKQILSQLNDNYYNYMVHYSTLDHKN